MSSSFESYHSSWTDFDPQGSEFITKESPFGCLEPITPEQCIRRNSSASSFHSDPGLIGSAASSFSSHTQPSTPGFDDPSPRDRALRLYHQSGLPPQTPRSRPMLYDHLHDSSPFCTTEFSHHKIFDDHRLHGFDGHDFKMTMPADRKGFRTSAPEPCRFDLDTPSRPESICPRETELPSMIGHSTPYLPSQYGKVPQYLEPAPIHSISHSFMGDDSSFGSSFASLSSDHSSPPGWNSSPGFHFPGQYGTVGLAAIENTSRSLTSVLGNSDIDAANIKYEEGPESDPFGSPKFDNDLYSPLRPAAFKIRVKRTDRRGAVSKRTHRRDRVQVYRDGRTFSAENASKGNQECKDCHKRFDRAEHLKRHEHSTACGGRVKEAINPCLLGKFCQLNKGCAEPKYFGSRGDNRNQHHITHLGWYDSKTGSKTRNTIVTLDDALFLIRKNGGVDAARHFQESVQAAREKRMQNVEDFQTGDPHVEAQEEIRRMRDDENANAQNY